MVESFGEVEFITFLVKFLVETNPGDLLTNLSVLSKHMLDKMPAQC